MLALFAMTLLDLAVLIWVGLWAALGAARGLLEQTLSLAGLALGALVGGRAVAALVPGADESEWLPLMALGGAIVGATLVQAALLRLTLALRRRVWRGRLRSVDRGGGLVAGGALGLFLAWLIAAVAIYQPGDRADGLRGEIRRSAILGEALRAVPPDGVLGALARIDPFPLLPLPATALPAPDGSMARDPEVLAARASVVEIRGTACGIGKEGSGWVAGDGLVVTNAHVVAGQDDSVVYAPDGSARPATAVAIDSRDDVAVLRVEGLHLPALELGPAPEGATPVALMGYPRGGPQVVEAATAAAPRIVLTPDAYGRGNAPRSVVVTRGSLGPGSSGGPVVDRRGRVVAMIFGGTDDGETGAAVPPGAIRSALSGPRRPVSTGPCG
ncbi:MAG: CvpA family protein [Thermoleophilia bacterium]